MLGARIGELADQLLLLGVRTDRRLAVVDEPLGHVSQIAELGVPIGMLAALADLGVGLQGITAQTVQQAQHRATRYLETLTDQFLGQLGRRLRRPAQQRHRIAARLGWTSSSSAANKPGCLSTSGLSPPPAARRRNDGSIPAATSASALITVLRLIPDAVATAVFPPRPSISAAAPATTRRCSSFMCGNTTAKNRASASGVTSTRPYYYARTNLAWTLRVLLRLSSS